MASEAAADEAAKVMASLNQRAKWDAHSPLYHVDTEEQYNEYYLNQLKEILEDPKYGNKGKFVEVWMDGAPGKPTQNGFIESFNGRFRDEFYYFRSMSCKTW